MWLSSEGVVHIVSTPSDSPSLRDLIELLSAVPDSQRQALDDDLQALELQTADHLDSVAHVPEVEERFVAEAVPADLLASLRWERLLGESMSEEFGLIELRWRLDVIGIAAQAIADLESA